MGGLFSALAKVFGAIQSDPPGPNPTMQSLAQAQQEKQNAERAAADADRRANEERAAKDRAEHERAMAEAHWRKADENQRLAEEARARADAERQRAEQEKQDALQEKMRAELEKLKAQGEIANANQEKARAEESRVIAENAQRDAEHIKAKADEERRKAEEERTRAQEQRAKAEEGRMEAEQERERARSAAAEADQKAEDEKAAREDAEAKWIKGIRPEIWPTMEEIAETKIRLQIDDKKYNFAVTGVSGGGKSSLINAVRGLRSSDRGAARTGIVETTFEITRYVDPNPANPIVWYDVPGAGTLTVSDWQYFHSQGLYALDCVIVLFDNRFTATDVAILRSCEKLKIPTYIVRSKSDVHIENMMSDMFDDDVTDDEEDGDSRRAAAREKYILETRENVFRNLRDAQVSQQKVYLVTKEAIVKIVKGRTPKTFIDDVDLLTRLLTDARERRPPPQKKRRFLTDVFDAVVPSFHAF